MIFIINIYNMAEICFQKPEAVISSPRIEITFRNLVRKLSLTFFSVRCHHTINRKQICDSVMENSDKII